MSSNLKIDNIIIAIAITVVAILILFSTDYGIYFEKLVYEVEWAAGLVLVGYVYRFRPKNNYITFLYWCFWPLQIWSLMDAIWISNLYFMNAGEFSDFCQLQNYVYDHTWEFHFTMYWFILAVTLLIPATWFCCWISGTLPSQNKK